jgi:hypothetical protein
MSLPICPMVQLLYRFFVGNENIEQTSKTEAKCKINYYLIKMGRSTGVCNPDFY